MGGSSISSAATRARDRRCPRCFKTMVSTKSAIDAEAMMKCLPALTALTQSQASQIAIRDKGVSGLSPRRGFVAIWPHYQREDTTGVRFAHAVSLALLSSGSTCAP
jgi:hypothetical protein